MFKLLIVDDEAIIRQGILRSIDWNRLNIEAFDACNGIIAYNMLLKENFDIVLLDIKMPGLNGLELIEKAQNSITDRDIIFVILSGYAEFSLAKQAMKYGVRYYLLKPTAQEDIISTLEKVISDIKVRNISHDNVVYLVNNISAYVREGRLQTAKDKVKSLFLMLKECEIKEVFVNYYLELFLLIVKQCEDYQQIPRYLKMSSEINIDTSVEGIYMMILKAIDEINDINHEFCRRKYCNCIRTVLDFIDENISNEELSLSYISNNIYMNSSYLGKLFKKEMKQSFNDYLSSIRINKAKQIIESNCDYKIYEIAEKVGFGSNTQYFSQVFKKYTGCAPNEYKAVSMERGGNEM